MPRVFEYDDIDVGDDANEDLDASNEEVERKEEEVERKEKVEPVATAAAAAKRSKSRRIEEEELRPEEQGRSEKQSM